LSGDSGVVFLSFASDAAGRFGMRRHADTHSLYV
jgi:hypothetical protein